jgi:hypothetical protein
VGRHNAVDAIAGKMWLDRVDGGDKIFYTTGRLTSEMVIKAAQMGIPFLVSRSGLTQMGFEIAQTVGITMIGRATGKHFLLFAGGNVSAPTRDAAPRSRAGPGRRQRRRMGTVDKGLVPLDGRPMVSTCWNASPQVDEILINANQHLDDYAAMGHRSSRRHRRIRARSRLHVGLARRTTLVATVPAIRRFCRRIWSLAFALRSTRDADLAVRALSISRIRCSRWCARESCRT